MFSTITTAPSTTIPKSSAPNERRLAGILLKSSQIEANIKENGIVMATIKAARTLPRKRRRMIVTRIIPSPKLCSNGMQGVMKQIAAVQHGNDLHAFGQDALVELFHLFVNPVERGPFLRALSASARCPG